MTLKELWQVRYQFKDKILDHWHVPGQQIVHARGNDNEIYLYPLIVFLIENRRYH